MSLAKNLLMQKENAKLLSDNRKQLKLKTSSGRVNREKVSKIVFRANVRRGRRGEQYRKCEINKQTRCRARHGNSYEYSNEVNIYGKLMIFFLR